MLSFGPKMNATLAASDGGNDTNIPQRDPIHDFVSGVYDPNPSPALSAYSYSSNSTADISDFDCDLGPLSLDAIEDPVYQLTSTDRPDHLAVSTDPHLVSPRPDSSYSVSGTSTPTASTSSTPLNRRRDTICQLNGSESLLLSFQQEPHQRAVSSSSDVTQPSSISPNSFGSQTFVSNQIEDDVELDGEDEVFDLEDQDEEDMHADGVPAARGWRLDARQADSIEFHQKVLCILSQELKLPGWSNITVDPSLLPLKPENLKLKRISGAFTNAVFFASYKVEKSRPDMLSPPTILLRVYGTGSEVLLSRRAELLILHTLSSLYGIGPHILGTFANGRVEEFYDCEPIQKHGMRDFGDRQVFMVPGGGLVVKGQEGQAHWVARRMNELHAVPLEVMRTVLEQENLKGPNEKGFGRGIETHIMASSHRPRRRNHRSKPNQTPSSIDIPLLPPLYGLEADNLIRASPAPMQPGETPSIVDSSSVIPSTNQRSTPGIDIANHNYYSHQNSSVASLDSLATSYNSQSSMSSDSLSLSNMASPPFGPIPAASTSSVPPAFYQPINQATKGLGSSTANKSHSSHPPPSSRSSRGPYPGVWRRLKRWSKEAAKVVELVEAFAKTESGAKAIAVAFAGHPTIREEMQQSVNGKSSLNVVNIGPSTGSLRNMLRCIRAIDLPSLCRELDQFKAFVRQWEKREGSSKRVFSHNDAQYGNLLAIKPTSSTTVTSGTNGANVPNDGAAESVSVPSGMPRHSASDTKAPNAARITSPTTPAARLPSQSRTHTKKPQPPHHTLVVIDFEYASPNPRAYDIANHFQEWRTDYHHPTLSWSLRCHGAYPDEQQRRKWLRAYVEQGRLLRMRGRPAKTLLTTEPLPTPTELALPPPLAPLSLSSSSSSSTDSDPTLSSTCNTLERFSSGERSHDIANAVSTSASVDLPSTTPGSSNSRTLEPRLSHESTSSLSSSSSWQMTAESGIRSPLDLNTNTNPTSSSCTIPTSSPNVTSLSSPSTFALARLDSNIETEIDRLQREIQLWSPATHAVWGLWGIVFARETVETILTKAKFEIQPSLHNDDHSDSVLGLDTSPQLVQFEAGSAESFDTLRYALERIELFRHEFHTLVQLGNEVI